MKKQKELSLVYNDVLIVYDEHSNSWKFTLRSRDRSADSLASAKEAIDYVPPVKKPAFKRIKCWKIDWHGDPVAGEVTSVAEKARYSSLIEVWFSAADQKNHKTKEKVSSSHIIPSTPQTDETVKEMLRLKHEASVIADRINELRDAMPRLKVDAEE